MIARPLGASWRSLEYTPSGAVSHFADTLKINNFNAIEVYYLADLISLGSEGPEQSSVRKVLFNHFSEQTLIHSLLQ
jgi:hypothetical protein